MPQDESLAQPREVVRIMVHGGINVHNQSKEQNKLMNKIEQRYGYMIQTDSCQGGRGRGGLDERR